MKTPRLLTLLGLCVELQLCTACVSAPDDTLTFEPETPVVQQSQHGLVAATLTLESAPLRRGPNDFSISLQAQEGTSEPTLTSVSATMVAHGHHAMSPTIVQQGQTFRIEQLDLFMSGRWDVTLGVELSAQSDSVEFALDVP